MIFTVTGAQTNNRVFIIIPGNIIFSTNNEESAGVQALAGKQEHLHYYNNKKITTHASHTTTFATFQILRKINIGILKFTVFTGFTPFNREISCISIMYIVIISNNNNHHISE